MSSHLDVSVVLVLIHYKCSLRRIGYSSSFLGPWWRRIGRNVLHSSWVYKLSVRACSPIESLTTDILKWSLFRSRCCLVDLISHIFLWGNSVHSESLLVIDTRLTQEELLLIHSFLNVLNELILFTDFLLLLDLVYQFLSLSHIRCSVLLIKSALHNLMNWLCILRLHDQWRRSLGFELSIEII